MLLRCISTFNSNVSRMDTWYYSFNLFFPKKKNNEIHRSLLLIDIDQQQFELTRYSTVQVYLLDFVDYCNDIIDIHPSTTPQYKCAVKVNHSDSRFKLFFFSHLNRLWYIHFIYYQYLFPKKNLHNYRIVSNRNVQLRISSISSTKFLK